MGRLRWADGCSDAHSAPLHKLERSRGGAMGINLGSLCREPPKLTLLTSGNPGDEGAPALAGGGEMVRKVTFDLKLYLRLAGSPPPLTRTPKTRVARFGEPRTQGRLCCGSHKLVGFHYVRPCSWEK